MNIIKRDKKKGEGAVSVEESKSLYGYASSTVLVVQVVLDRELICIASVPNQ